MINFKNIYFSIGGVPLFENASGFVPTGHKVGIVGRNGAGKTTLFKLILNEIILDGGVIEVPKNYKIGYVPQHGGYFHDLTVYENAFANDSVSTCEFYDWNGVRYTSSGVYVDTFQTSNGCDSIVSLSLNLFPVYQDTIFASACDSFVWYGNTYTSAGIYINSFSTICQ